MQEAVISTVNDNYDDVYHGVREGYSGAYQPLAGDFEESLDYGDIYGRLDDILGLTYRGGYHTQYTEDVDYNNKGHDNIHLKWKEPYIGSDRRKFP